jgi:hypothetical protein
MAVITEHERVIAEAFADSGYSYAEIAHRLLERRNRGLQRVMVKEIAAIFSIKKKKEKGDD